jgi:hypothetical protein
MMQDVQVLMGTFVVKGQIRISSQTELAAGLEVVRHSWLSLYDAEIANPYLPQMPLIRVPLMLLNPEHIAFAL